MFKNKHLKYIKNWVDKFFVNYSFFSSKKIDIKEFLKKVNTEEIQLDNLQEESISIVRNASKPDSNVKMYKSPKKEVLKATASS